MKKLIKILMFVISSTILMAQNPAEEVMEKIRHKIKVEEEKKLKEEQMIEERRKIEEQKKLEEEKRKQESAMELMEEKRREHGESIVEKTYRSGSDTDKQLKAMDRSFEVAEQRISFKKVEEENILVEEKRKGIEKDHSKDFVSDKFNEVNEKYKLSQKEIEALLKQQKEMENNLKKLEEMEKIIKK